MTGNDSTPDPQLLAAYFDGELHRRANTRVDQIRRVEEWLEAHPLEAIAEREAHARVAEALADASPPEPCPEAWRRLQKQLHDSQQGLPRLNRRKRRRHGLLLVAAAASLLLLAWAAWPTRQPAPDQPAPNPQAKKPVAPAVEVFEVATAAEITIIRMAGSDTPMLAVNQLDIFGGFELASRSDVEDLTISPASPELPETSSELRFGSTDRPVVWTPTKSE